VTERPVAQVESPSATARAQEAEPQVPGQETAYLPAVDIWEDSQGIRLVADMPGVAQESVNVTVENRVLTIEGRARVDAPAGYELVSREYSAGRYRRDFTLSETADPEGIRARVHNGVLEVTIPKRPEARTRKVKIETQE